MSSAYLLFKSQSEKIWVSMPNRERQILETIYSQNPNNPLHIGDLLKIRSVHTPLG